MGEKMLGRTKAGMDDMKTGLKLCATESSEMFHYAGYADQLDNHLKDLAEACGFTYDELPETWDDPAVPEPPTPGEPSCKTISKEFFGMLDSKGWKPLYCK